tara:strand:+ start:172 stop:354 length:183 start_codon:yes stop_codon:yes gene_type:complete
MQILKLFFSFVLLLKNLLIKIKKQGHRCAPTLCSQHAKKSILTCKSRDLSVNIVFFSYLS